MGKSEASICCVIKARAKFTIASPLTALHMKASDSCKIQLKFGPLCAGSLLGLRNFRLRFNALRRDKSTGQTGIKKILDFTRG